MIIKLQVTQNEMPNIMKSLRLYDDGRLSGIEWEDTTRLSSQNSSLTKSVKKYLKDLKVPFVVEK